MARLEVSAGPLRLKNPVLLASGCCGYGREFEGLSDVARLGGICTKGLTLKPRLGNPTPRTVETPAGMLNSIGLENVGVDAFELDKMPWLRDNRVTAIANFFGQSVGEYAELAGRLDNIAGLAAVELNLSCPNVEKGGRSFGQDRGAIAEVTAAVKAATKLPVIVKLTPNVTDIVEMALAAKQGGADAVSVINTLVGMKVDIEKRRPVLAYNTGGLSGPAIKPIAVAMARKICAETDIPVIGIGGIRDAADALEFLLAGAKAIQVGTWLFTRPAAGEEVLDGLNAQLDAWGVKDVNEIIGALHDNPRP